MISGPIGLTGGIASGKSTVASLFRAWGAFVADADEISRHALDPDTDCYEKTVAAFGRGILHGDGTVDRRKVASIVFSDKKALNLLNGIIHPYVRRIIRADLISSTGSPVRDTRIVSPMP